MAHLRSQSITTLVFLSFLVSNAIDTDETAYLLKLRKAITPAPSQWFETTDMCAWKGIMCGYYNNYSSSFVHAINLSSMSLSGELPPYFSNSFFHLKFLRLQNNFFHGPLPSLDYLPELQEVYLNHNNFTSVPNNCFTSLSKLQSLRVSYNPNLGQWTFPTSLTNSFQLVNLDLAAANLVGSLPDIFNSFHNLQVLMLQGNHLTGKVPPSLMNLSSLRNVSLANNWLQGPQPVFGEHVRVDLRGNGFCLNYVGPCDWRVAALLNVAAGFGYPLLLARSWRGNNPCDRWNFTYCDKWGKIRTVKLTNLKLKGVISPAFADLIDLEYLYLGGNELGGSTPESLATLTQLKILDVSNNTLSGKVLIFSPKVRFLGNGNSFLDDHLSQTNGTTSTTSSSPPRIAWLVVKVPIFSPMVRFVGNGNSFLDDHLSQTNGTTSTTSSSPPGVLAGVGLMIIMYLMINSNNRKMCFSLLQKMIWKKTSTFSDHNVEDFIKTFRSITLKRYSYGELKRITNSFHEKLGQGGYGIVYKARLVDGRQVAVKVLKELKGRGEEFVNEVITIGRTSHVNIVSLLGFCYEINKRALVYEFMSNGSLDKFIYKKGSSTAVCDLDWNTLYRITIGIARGLEYLHRGCNTKILHLDIKPQNILLDENFTPKIADFGLAKICKKDESVVSMLGARGTPGFIAPEVFSRTYGGVSHKSDVYSYGMLILEVVGGRKNYDSEISHTSKMYFPDWIYKNMEQPNILAKCLSNTEEENETIMKITLVSLWCIQIDPKNRPSMSKVVEMLEGPLGSIPYPPKPVLHSPERLPIRFEDISSSSHVSNSLATENNGSIT